VARNGRIAHNDSDERKFFSQSYEARETLDSAVLIMPLVSFRNQVTAATAYVSRCSSCRLRIPDSCPPWSTS
jgi:GH15 family glucan-1,4-alpha-glucosidase